MKSNKKPPTAPPAYQPQSVPRVLQTKKAAAKAPPVYRPQPTPLVAQRKELKHGPKATSTVRPPSTHPLLARAAQAKMARPAASLPARTIQRQKADAQDYANKNGIAITASHQTVTDYVNNTANDKTKRKGLLEAWNLNNARWAIPEPADFATATGPTDHRSIKSPCRIRAGT